MSKKDELTAERKKLFDEHRKFIDENAKKSYEWSVKNHKGGLDGYNPYDEEMSKLHKEFCEKAKKIHAEIEKLKD